jgi:hypothetical protein
VVTLPKIDFLFFLNRGLVGFREGLLVNVRSTIGLKQSLAWRRRTPLALEIFFMRIPTYIK